MAPGSPSTHPRYPVLDGREGYGRRPASDEWSRKEGMVSIPKLERTWPHLDDLVVKAVPDLDIHAPIKTLLLSADGSAKQADACLDFRRPDLAYSEYLKASNILLDLVPRHKDFPALCSDKGELWRLNKGLQNRINSQHKTFEGIRELIKADNAQSGVRPANGTSRNGGLSSTHQTSNIITPTSSQILAPYDAPNALPIPDGPGNGSIQEHLQAEPLNPDVLGIPRRKPIMSTKKEDLHNASGTLQTDMPPGDPLVERLARLRRTDGAHQRVLPVYNDQTVDTRIHRPHSANNMYGARWAVNSPSPPILTPSSSATSLSAPYQVGTGSQTLSSAKGLLGPRDMPSKLSISSQAIQSMPRPPSPTYSPSRNIPPSTYVNSPKITTSSVVRSDERAEFKSSTGAPRPTDYSHQSSDISITSSTLNGNIQEARLGAEARISVRQLYEYLRRGSVNFSMLLIDVRSREAFSEGHIFGPSIICVEPVGLRPNTSAEDIEGALVLAPENEQRLFNARDQFDLVVYYDQSSITDLDRAAQGSKSNQQYLSALRRALWDYNYTKPLKQAPAQLIGGLDAWIDLVGSQALKVSDPPIPRKSGAVRANGQSASPVRQAMYSANKKGVMTLRLHEDERLKPRGDTTRVTRATTKNNEQNVGLAPRPRLENNVAGNGLPPQEDERHFVRTYDDFLRRFPEPSDLKESMISPTSPRGRTLIDHPFHNFTGVQGSPEQRSNATGIISSSVLNPPSRPPPAVPRRSYSGVSEKVSYQLPAPSRPPPVAPPAPFSDRSSYHSELQIGRTGLTNFGATCYMNAVTQCLSATSPLTRYFLDGSYKGAVQRQNKMGSNGVLPDVYSNLMRHLWDGNFSFISPKSFREFISRLNEDFKNPDVQHDANDFLVFILDALHEDLNRNFSRTRLNDLTAVEERRRESMPPQIASRVEWNRWSHRNMSWVSSLFGGQHLSRLQCSVCRCKSTSYETFYSISLEIPKQGRAHVYDCLRNYTKEERLGAEDSWTCPNCKVPREATKRITITRAPQILVIQLKRFKSVRRGFTDKNSTMIDFPLKRLDLTPFTVPSLSAQDAREAEAKYGSAILEPQHETSPPFEYDAYGVVQHFGTLTGGHYTALIRTDPRGHWMEYNDKIVRDFDSRYVQSAAAYLLFYVRSNVQL